MDTLQTTMHDPRGAWEIAANTFAAAVGIPFTILFGQQTGRLASDEDKAADNARCKSRQRNLLTGAVTAVIRRLQACGIVEASDFEVEWAPLDAMGDAEKADLADKMAGINEKMVKAGKNAPFNENEVRKVMEYEEEEGLDDMPGEGDPDDDELDPLPARGEPPPRPAPTGNAVTVLPALPDLTGHLNAAIGAMRAAAERPIAVHVHQAPVQVNVPPAEMHVHQGDTHVTAKIEGRGTVIRTPVHDEKTGRIKHVIEKPAEGGA